MNSLFNYNDLDCPQVSQSWQSLPEETKIKAIHKVLVDNNFDNDISVTRVESNGFVYVNLNNVLSASNRGTILLNLEEKLKEVIDLGVTVWCEPLGDRSSLRNLRGIQIKSGIGD